LKWTELRRPFFLSNGHISPVLQRFKKRLLPVAELATFRLINSRLQGHPTTHDSLQVLESHHVLVKDYL
jgi:transketolase N-terminal domain/subunit